MDIRDLNWLMTDQELSPFSLYSSLDEKHSLVDAHFRAAHPDNYWPLAIEDQRFPKEFSWMRVHACAFDYLYFWCIKPDSKGEVFSLQQRVAAIFVKPLAAVSDCIIDTVLLNIKFAILIDRIAIYTLSLFLRMFISLENHPKTMPSTEDRIYMLMTEAGLHAAIQGLFFSQSIFTLCNQPINVIGNLFSPKADFLAMLFELDYGYVVINPQDEEEYVLDQGIIKYLREHCGWEHVTDAMLKH